MRIWHYKLLPYLPERQFRGQLRELIAIMREWREQGRTNHVLINRVMDYHPCQLTEYFLQYAEECKHRYSRPIREKYLREFMDFAPAQLLTDTVFERWHNQEYLRVCMANLYEKHRFGKGYSRITDEEWALLLQGYREITGKEYRI